MDVIVPTRPHPVVGLPLCRWQDSNLLDAFTLSGYRDARRGHVQHPWPRRVQISTAFSLHTPSLRRPLTTTTPRRPEGPDVLAPLRGRRTNEGGRYSEVHRSQSS